MKKSSLMLIACLLPLVSSCSDKAEEDEYSYEVKYLVSDAKLNIIKLTDKEEEFVSNNNTFAFDLYKTFNSTATGQHSNIISPISVTFLLGMLNSGADDIASNEITSVVGFGKDDPDALNNFCKKIIENSPLSDTGVTLNITNAQILNDSVDLNESYKEIVETSYRANVLTTDFSSEDALPKVNSWYSELTDGRLSNAFSEIKNDAILYLMNSVYFYSTWQYAFDEKNTEQSDFIKNKEEVVQVPMMRQKAVVRSKNFDKMMIIRLPYSAGGFYMDVLLPEDGYSTEDVLSYMNSEEWDNISRLVDEEREIDISLPRFSISNDVSLKAVLSDMGIKSPFDENVMHMDRMFVDIKGFVTDMKQSISLKVDERGSEVVTMTVGKVKDITSNFEGSYPKDEFNANKPFIYVISEASTGTIFFIGTYQGD